MPKIEKDLLKVKGSDGQWHYVPAVGGGDTPTWETVQDKPFESLGDGLLVENGVLSAKGGTGSSANAVQYTEQTLTDEQKAQARKNIDADKKRLIYNATRGNYGRVNLFDSVSSQNAAIDKIIAEYEAGTEVVMRLQDRDFPLIQISKYGGKIWFSSYSVTTDAKMNVVTFMLEKDTTAVEENYINGIKPVNIDSTLQITNYAADAKAVGDALGTKLDKNQGARNAGKILGVGEDGNVVPEDKPTYTLTDADKTAVAEEVVADGIAATLVDMPSGGGGDETWEKLVDTSLAESAESVTYAFDNCKKVKALIAPAIANGEFVSGWIRITINNVAYPSFNGKVNFYEGIDFEIDSEYPPYVQGDINAIINTTTYGIVSGKHAASLENIAPNGVTEFGCRTAGLLKAGTKIEIWGVKS